MSLNLLRQCGLDLFSKGLQHADKNLFPDNLPYNSTLVKLEGGEYINASRVLEGRLICTQSPGARPDDGVRPFAPQRLRSLKRRRNPYLQGALRAWEMSRLSAQRLLEKARPVEAVFWRMIQECRVPIIVMLNDVGFTSKTVFLSQYYPQAEGDVKEYGQIRVECGQVSTTRIDERLYWVQRKLYVTSGEEVQEVRHIKCYNWPEDHSEEASSSELVMLLAQMVSKVKHAKEKLPEGPVLIHCEAGLGRTGAFATILEESEQKTPDVTRCLERLRGPEEGRSPLMGRGEWRPLLCEQVLAALNTRVTKLTTGQLKEEFSRLTVCSRAEERRVGRENPAAHRFVDNVPYDDTRVALRSGVYMNASLVLDGRYLCTQAPRLSDMEVFWQMIDEQKVSVMAQLNETTRETPCYWPQLGESVSLGGVALEGKSEQYYVSESAGWQTVRPACREFLTKRIVQVNGREVAHLQYTGWRDHGVPGNLELLACYAQEIDRLRRQSEDAPVLVHCLAGLGRTGALVTVLEQLSLVDPHTRMIPDVERSVHHSAAIVRRLREPETGRHPAMVQNFQQYQLIADVLDILGLEGYVRIGELP
jgi:protein tyrosine phosphatase